MDKLKPVILVEIFSFLEGKEVVKFERVSTRFKAIVSEFEGILVPNLNFCIPPSINCKLQNLAEIKKFFRNIESITQASHLDFFAYYTNGRVFNNSQDFAPLNMTCSVAKNLYCSENTYQNVLVGAIYDENPQGNAWQNIAYDQNYISDFEIYLGEHFQARKNILEERKTYALIKAFKIESKREGESCPCNRLMVFNSAEEIKEPELVREFHSCTTSKEVLEVSARYGLEWKNEDDTMVLFKKSPHPVEPILWIDLERSGSIDKLVLNDWFLGNYTYYLLIDGHIGEADTSQLKISMSSIYAQGATIYIFK